MLMRQSVSDLHPSLAALAARRSVGPARWRAICLTFDLDFDQMDRRESCHGSQRMSPSDFLDFSSSAIMRMTFVFSSEMSL